jgi:hypothetical protein
MLLRGPGASSSNSPAGVRAKTAWRSPRPELDQQPTPACHALAISGGDLHLAVDHPARPLVHLVILKAFPVGDLQRDRTGIVAAGQISGEWGRSSSEQVSQLFTSREPRLARPRPSSESFS